jgi:DNA-binding transcriptional MerR regulator
MRNTCMKERHLRIRDIAEETGISETSVRTYVQEFGDLLPSHRVGRVKLYREPAVNLIRKIDALASEGSSPEDIASALRRGGTQRSRAPAHARSRPQTRTPPRAGPAKPPAAPAPAPAPPLPPVDHLRGLRDTIALQEQQIKAIHRRLDAAAQADERLAGEIADLCGHLGAVQAAHARQVEIIEQWMAYYERRLDLYEASAQANMEQMRRWIDYLEEGLERANESLTTKIRRMLH